MTFKQIAAVKAAKILNRRRLQILRIIPSSIYISFIEQSMYKGLNKTSKEIVDNARARAFKIIETTAINSFHPQDKIIYFQ